MTDILDPMPPRDFAALRDMLISNRIKLPRRLAQVAAFAMSHPDEIAFETVAVIAERAEVQPSTLVRFSQAIGFQGFSELQTLFRDRIKDRISSYDDRLKRLHADTPPDNKAAALFDGFCDASTKSIRNLQERIEPQLIDKAVKTLASADTVYLIAQRRSYPITSYMAYAFGKLGIKTVLVGTAAGLDSEILNFAGPQDAAIAISFTPYASSTLSFARQIAQRGTPLVVITDSPFSPLVADAKLWFEVVEADFEGFRSLAATMALAMTLTVAVADARRGSA